MLVYILYTPGDVAPKQVNKIWKGRPGYISYICPTYNVKFNIQALDFFATKEESDIYLENYNKEQLIKSIIL